MAFKNILTTALLGVSAVNAHLIMTNPVPYGKDSLNNSPLAADGSDFPCKQRSGVYDVGKENTYSVGDAIPLAFQGSATHGGGSCQVSLTTDRNPTKDSNWMVIKSIEGGCPVNTEGNLSGGETNKVPTDLNFTIPDGIGGGKYTMAWTWFNRVGNREMYMNCAPVTVQGGSSKRAEEEAAVEKRGGNFPGMFVANVNGCTTPESKDLRFPDPGDDVEYNGTPSNLMSQGEKSCTGTAKFGGGSGGSGGGGGGGASVSASIGVNVGGGGGAAATQSASSGGFAADSGSSSSSSAPAPTQPAASGSSSSSSGSDSGSSSSGSSSSSAPSSDSSSSSSGSSSGAAQSGSCDKNGAWNCIDGSTYQRCASGQWTEAQQMAAGTECSPGEDEQNLSIKATLNARMSSEMRHRKRSLHHGAHHA